MNNADHKGTPSSLDVGDQRLSSSQFRAAFLAALLWTLSFQGLIAQEEGTEAETSEVEQLRHELAVLRGDVTSGPSSATDSDQRMKWFAHHQKMVEESKLSEIPFQFVGPTNVSGRVTDVAVPKQPRGSTYTVYVATASGGVWRTKNEGTTWEPIFENEATVSIGDIAVDPQDPDKLWVGTGEANIFRSSMAGCGIYKSTDGGESWQHMGLAATHTIARIVIHPENSNVIYVAASGHEWTNNQERGVYRSQDGGKSWEKVLYIDEQTGAIDLVIDPKEPNRLYAATWQRIRKRWNDPRNEVGYQGSGVYRSEDGGESWQLTESGLPEAAHRGRIGLDLCASQPEVVYAFVDSYEPSEEKPEGNDSYGRPRKAVINGAEVYRSNDHGKTWEKASPSNRYMRGLSSTYGWVFGQMRVDPSDPETLYVMGLALNVSNDGGKSFRRLRGMHGDHHALWIDPENPDYLINGNDGGVAISYDGGKNWRTFYDNLPVVQFYNLGFDMAEPFRVYGSVQDHGSYRGEVRLGRGRDRIRPVEFERAPGGEASTHEIDPENPDRVFSAGFYGSITRNDLDSGERKRIVPKPLEGELPLRGQWLAPFLLSPHNPGIVYHGMNFLYRSLDRGDHFERISADLSYDDPGKYGDIPFQTIFSVSESPIRFGLVYAGTDDGRLHVTPNGGASWTEITQGLAKSRWISRVVASAYRESKVYVAQNGKRHDDFASYLWKSDDQGQTWVDISEGIPLGPINVIREDPKHEGWLYVGTDVGVYVSFDDGANWLALPGGLPTTYVHDLRIHPRDSILVIATHGRGIWALDVEEIYELRAPKAAVETSPEAEELDEEVEPEAAKAHPSLEALAGQWEGRLLSEEIDQDRVGFQILMSLNQGKLDGHLSSAQGKRKIEKATYEGGKLKFFVESEMGEAFIEAQCEPGAMKGKMNFANGSYVIDFKAKKANDTQS